MLTRYIIIIIFIIRIMSNNLIERWWKKEKENVIHQGIYVNSRWKKKIKEGLESKFR